METPPHATVNPAFNKLKVLSDQDPWPGLPAFQEQDERYFFGRADEKAALVELVKRSPVSVLYGQSGLGKTSLLLAGLFPELRKMGYLPLWLRLNYSEKALPLRLQILGPLAEALEAYRIEGPRPGSDEGLWEYFHRRDLEFWGERNRLMTPVIVLDQFEEIFTLGQRSDALAVRSQEWIRELEAVLEHRPPRERREALDAKPEEAARFDLRKQSARFVLSLREDFLPQLESLRQQLPSLQANRLRLERMTGAQALQVVLQAGKKLLNETVARRIVEFVSTSQRRRSVRALETRQIEPALLSVVCDGLNQKRLRKEQPSLSEDLIEAEREGILEDFYEDAFEGTEDRVRDWVEDHLLTSSGYRQPGSLDNARAAGIPEEAFGLLENRRILHRDDRDEVVRLELTHDLLTDPATRSRDRRVQRRAAAAAAAAAAEKAALAEKAAREAEAEARKLAIEAEEAAKRLKESESNRRKLGTLALVAVIAVVLAVLAWISALKRGQEVNRQRELAETNAVRAETALVQLQEKERERAEAAQRSSVLTAKNAEIETRQRRARIAEELSAIDRMPYRSSDAASALALIGSALRREPTDRHLAAMCLAELSGTTWPIPAMAPQILPGIPEEILISPQDNWIAMRTTNQVLVADYPRFERGLWALPLDRPPVGMKFSDDGSLIGVKTLEDGIEVFATAPRTRTVRIAHASTDVRLEFSRDGQVLLGGASTESGGGGATGARHGVVWLSSTGEAIRRFEPAGRADAFCITQDGRRVAALTPDHRLVLWDTTSASPKWTQELRPVPSTLRFILQDRFLLVTWPGTNRTEAHARFRNTQQWYTPIEIRAADSGTRVVGPVDVPGEMWDEDPESGRFSLFLDGEFVEPMFATGRTLNPGRIRIPETVLSSLVDPQVFLKSGRGNKVGAIAGSGDWFSVLRAGGELWTYDNRASYWTSTVSTNVVDLRSGSFSDSIQVNADRSRLLVVAHTNLQLYGTMPALILNRSLSLPIPVTDARWVDGGEHVLGRFTDGTARILRWEGREGMPTDWPPPLLGSTQVSEIRTTPDGRVGLLVFANGRVQGISLTNRVSLGPELGPFEVESGQSWPGKLCSDGSRIAVIDRATNLVVIDLASGRSVGQAMTSPDPIGIDDISEDGAVLLLSTWRRGTMIWDLDRSQTAPFSLSGSGSTGTGALRPDGGKAFGVSSELGDYVWRIWARDTGLEESRRDVFSGTFYQNLGFSSVWLDSELIGFSSGDLISLRYRRAFGLREGSYRFSFTQPPVVQRAGDSGAAGGALSTPCWRYGWEDRKLAAFEAPWLEEDPPVWLAELAEAVGGERLERPSGSRLGIPPSAILRLREQILLEPDRGGWRRWARWFFSDRAGRSPSPSAPGLEGVETNGNSYRRQSADNHPLQVVGAWDWYRPNDRLLPAITWAERLDPLHLSVRRARAAFWRFLGNRSEELLELEGALAAGPPTMDLLLECMLSRAENRKTNEVIEAWEGIRALHPERRMQYEILRLSDGPVVPKLGFADITKISEAMRRVGLDSGAAEAVRELVKMPSRDATLPAGALDLDAYSNSALNDLSGSPDPNFSDETRRGLRGVVGVPFDARAALRLGLDDSGGVAITNLSGIRIEQKARRLHFLHGGSIGGGVSASMNSTLAFYHIRYRDGHVRTIPLNPGAELGESWQYGGGGPTPVWPTNTTTLSSPWQMPKVFHFTWTNPEPGNEILSLDVSLNVVSSFREDFTRPRFFLLAITAEE